MFAYSAIANLPQNLQAKALQMHKNSLRTAPVSAIPPTNSTQTLAKNLSGILFDTSTGVPLKWSVLAWKLRQQEILRGKSSGTEVSAFQEFSQRYADPTKDLEFVLREARLQDPKNRQNSIEVVQDNPEARVLAQGWERAQTRVKLAAIEAYNWAIDNGIAKEQARAVLPEGMMSSRLYMNGTLRSWIHFIELRSANGTQKEHQEVARACAEAIAAIFPMASTLAE
jgi:hypothetical protein